MRTLIADIKRNSLDDGPGIRTVIFFKGCPLSCTWCQNPEAKSTEPEISYEQEACIGCGSCVDVCDSKAVDPDLPGRIDRRCCDLCGRCVDVCSGGALKIVGREYDIETLLPVLLKDKTFYKTSGGGVTLSGGEPTLHPGFLTPLLQALKADKIHICLETSGFFDFETVRDAILPYIDLIYYDLKMMDDRRHVRYCGVSNKRIFENFERLLNAEAGTDILPRIPLIPDVTTTPDNLKELAEYLSSRRIKKIGLLPYNPLWHSKAEAMGAPLVYQRRDWLQEDEKKYIKTVFSDFSFNRF
jgi:pyruvate formate lyase activating enzyme